MRIALIAPPFIPIPPTRYGGTELFLAHLAEGLQANGVEVVLYSVGDSKTQVENRWLYSHSEWPISSEFAGQMRDLNHSSWAVADAMQHCDLIHVNSPSALAFSRLGRQPFLCTLHHPKVPELSEFYLHYPDVQYVSISDCQAKQEPMSLIRTIHHGIDTTQYCLKRRKQDYVCFLGRIAPVKGTHIAIEVAKRAGIPLKIAGEIQPMFRSYYEEMIAPHIDGRFIEYVGEADLQAKNELLGNARALLFPIQWDEPFGLVMIEALACGTPVFGFARGSVPEVIQPGLSGEISMDVAQMAEQLRNMKNFHAQSIRQYLERNFSMEAMTRKYIELYREVTGISEARTPRVLGNFGLEAA